MQSRISLKIAAFAVAAGFSASAFALTPGAGTWVKESSTYGTPNLQDAYVYVPKNPAPAVIAGKRALMLSLHGCGQTASTSVIGNRFAWEATAEKYGMVVVAPTVPSGTSSTRAASGCWDWFGANHNRTSRDVVPLIKLIDAVRARTSLDIDPNQIYVSGLSSGAGETHVLGCSFPDYFAGVAPNAEPTLGSEAGDISVAPKRSAQQVADTCRAINGNQYNAYFNTQIFANVWGDKDYLVLPAHNVVNRDGMRIVYGANTQSPTETVTGGGTVTTWKDASGRVRVSSMLVAGMSHAWPAGPGGVGSTAWVDYAHVDYPAYLTKFFFENNQRINRWKMACSATATSNGVTVSGSATAAAGASVVNYKVSLKGATAVTDNAAGSGASFSKGYNLANGRYTGTVVAVDSKGLETSACDLPEFRVGDPTILPPSNLRATGISSSAIKLTWTAAIGASSYEVTRDGTVKLSATGTELTDSGLNADATYTYTVRSIGANDVSVPSAPVSARTQIRTYTDMVTATVTAHYSAGRINVNQYLQLGAKYGYNASITLYKCDAGWTNSATCAPLQ